MLLKVIFDILKFFINTINNNNVPRFKPTIMRNASGHTKWPLIKNKNQPTRHHRIFKNYFH